MFKTDLRTEVPQLHLFASATKIDKFYFGPSSAFRLDDLFGPEFYSYVPVIRATSPSSFAMNEIEETCVLPEIRPCRLESALPAPGGSVRVTEFATADRDYGQVGSSAAPVEENVCQMIDGGLTYASEVDSEPSKSLSCMIQTSESSGTASQDEEPSSENELACQEGTRQPSDLLPETTTCGVPNSTSNARNDDRPQPTPVQEADSSSESTIWSSTEFTPRPPSPDTLQESLMSSLRHISESLIGERSPPDAGIMIWPLENRRQNVMDLEGQRFELESVGDSRGDRSLGTTPASRKMAKTPNGIWMIGGLRRMGLTSAKSTKRVDKPSAGCDWSGKSRCKRCCPHECFEAFKSVCKRLRKF